MERGIQLKKVPKFPKKCQTTIYKEPAGVLQSFVPLRQSALIRFLEHSSIHSTSHYSDDVISHLESTDAFTLSTVCVKKKLQKSEFW